MKVFFCIIYRDDNRDLGHGLNYEGLKVSGERGRWRERSRILLTKMIGNNENEEL